ncbi:hypothetical protein IC229_10205 [Spirosoma sp. BT702]|uniref:DUF4595 domain-containing protein n=1 Tax=Spirosoma profusum TaxID=2771354 RepID=A0A927ATS9_9BACT|nr:hypothetical protein [Spirosoma profusum]MBD2701007.1 hypothetical protein [Spirosoma profusum]
MKKLLIFSLIGLLAISCKKENEVSPTTTSTTTCTLDGFTDYLGNEVKINSLDASGRITQATVKQTQGQVLTVVSTFVYETNGQLKSGTMTFRDESGRQIASQPQTYSYENGLLTTAESRCGCAQNSVAQRITLRYNAAKQLIERTQDSPGSTEKYVTVYGYDTKGNVLKETSTMGGISSSEFTYTYDDAKHPHQLLKGLPLNMFMGLSPWPVNVPMSVRAEYLDEKGQKQVQDLKRTDLKANATGYATSVSYGPGINESYALSNCN